MQLKIGFAKARGFVPLAWAVELIERTPYSHTYFRWLSNSGADQVYETTMSTKTDFVAPTSFLTAYTILEEYEFNLTDDEAAIFTALCAKFQGIPYGFWQLVGTGLCRLFGFKKNILSSGTGRLDCTELCLRVMQALPQVFTGVDKIKQSPDTVGLKTLFNFVSTHPNGTKI